MPKFQSTKVFTGFSTVFRQWQAEASHCKYLHGYAIWFKLWFEGELDSGNEVWDFDGMLQATSKIDGLAPMDWVKHMFDHTVIVAADDPYLAQLLALDKACLAQVRVVKSTGAARFAELIYEKMNPLVLEETAGRVRVVRVEFFEYNDNSAIYEPHDGVVRAISDYKYGPK